MSYLTDNADGYSEYELQEDQLWERKRARKQNSKPTRSKRRPRFSKALPGKIMEVSRGRYRVSIEVGVDSCSTESEEYTAMADSALRQNPPLVGDRVRVLFESGESAGELGRIVELLPRQTLFQRSAENGRLRPVVANVEQLLVVVAAADPPPRSGLVERLLVAAYSSGISPLLCITKCDLADPADFLSKFRNLGLPVVCCEQNAEGELEKQAVEQLLRLLTGHFSAAAGHSGVGKSTLVNRLCAGNRAVGQVNRVTGRGRHTSSSIVALPLVSGAGHLIDTPGVRSFGVEHVDSETILKVFPDLKELSDSCPRRCQHGEDRNCALLWAAAEGRITWGRLRSLLRLLRKN